MFSDLRFATRQLRKSPGFTVTAIITLALGIGANAMVFSVLNALLLRPANVPDAQTLYQVQRKYQNMQVPSHSYLNYIDLRDRNRTFASLADFMIIGPVGVDTGGNPSTAWPYLASANYFDAFEIQPYLGRFFHASDDKGYDSAPYVVLSYAYWSSHFRQDPGVVGSRIDINKHPFTILGVAPKEFHGSELFFAPAMWIPLIEQPTVMGTNNLQYRGAQGSWVVGHLKPGVTPAMASAELNSISAWLAKTYPADDDGMQLSLARPGLGGDFLGKPARAFMAGLMLLAGLILLAACANLGSLFAARAADRAKEVALRLALGSRRATILRQLLTEALVVSAAGGAVGLAGSLFLLRAVSAWNPVRDIPINVPVNPDLRTYVVALLLAILSALLFGIVPVGQVLRADPWQVIRTGSAAGGVKKFMLRDVLLVVQIAICALLVTSSLVAVRGLMRSLGGNYGFSPQSVTLVNSELRMSGYSEDNVAQMQRRMIDAAAAIPGVTSVGTVSQIPLSINDEDADVFLDSATDYRPTNAVGGAMNYVISPGYLDAAGHQADCGPRSAIRRRQKRSDRRFDQSPVRCARLRVGPESRRRPLQVLERKSRGGCGRCGRRQVPHPERGTAVRHVLFIPAAFAHHHMACGAVRTRSAGDGAGARSDAARIGFQLAANHRTMDPGDGCRDVHRARCDGGARSARAARRDAGSHGSLWNGFLCREQTGARIGHSRGVRRRAA